MSDQFALTPERREQYRRKFLEMLGRLGYACPVYSHVRARAGEFEVLQQMETEGLVKREKQRVDRDGYPNSRGKSFRERFVATEAGKPLADAAYAEYREAVRIANARYDDEEADSSVASSPE